MKSWKIRGQYQTGGFFRSLSKSDLDKTETGRVLAICFEAKSPEKHIKVSKIFSCTLLAFDRERWNDGLQVAVILEFFPTKQNVSRVPPDEGKVYFYQIAVSVF